MADRGKSLRARAEQAILRRLLALVTEESQPNLNALNDIAREVRILELNVKALGYELARRMATALPPPRETEVQAVGLRSKLSTQADIESDWTQYWAGQLRTSVIYHRKLWELVYVLQAIWEHGHMLPGARGLGFGCGVEPIPSYLASQGVAVTVTDIPRADAEARGWAATNQHLHALDAAHHPHLIDRASFDALAQWRPVDMNAVPDDLTGYDFCWSVCALEHLGSIAKGLDFVEASLRTLRPGGLAVHTMEFNVERDGPTIDNWSTVLFQQKHIEALAARLSARGHSVAPLDFHAGGQPMDHFIDVPPWLHDFPAERRADLGQVAHLKLSIDGFVCTCFGLIVRKGG